MDAERGASVQLQLYRHGQTRSVPRSLVEPTAGMGTADFIRAVPTPKSIRARSGRDTTAGPKEVLRPLHPAIECAELSAQDVKPFSDRRPDRPLEVADVVAMDVPGGRTGVI